MKKMYVLVRNDLPKTYRMVMGTHAVLRLCRLQPEVFEEWGNHTIVFLKVNDIDHLVEEVERAKGLQFPVEFWRENDIGFVPAAAAVYCQEGPFKHLRLNR